MKKLLTLLFSLLISFNSYGDWVYVAGDSTADGFIDKKTIKEQNGYVYFWVLQNKLTADETGIMSVKVYAQGDCEIDRVRFLTYRSYKEPMGNGEKEDEYTPVNPEWDFISPDSVGGTYLYYACDYVK